MQLRPVAPQDTNALARLTRRAIQSCGPSAYGAEQVAAWQAFATPDQVAAHLRRADSGFVAANDDALMGFATRVAAEIDLVYVDPEHQRKGVARALVMAVAEDAARAGYDRLELDASLVALAVFGRLGFQERGRTRNIRHGVEIETVRMAARVGDILSGRQVPRIR